MKRGKGKRKGSKFERLVCRMFSLWWTGGETKEAFWRSGGSGSMGTISKSKVHRGDIVQVQHEINYEGGKGHPISPFPGCIECKHHAFIDPWKKNNKLFIWLDKLVSSEAGQDQVPLLVFKQNQRDIFIVFPVVEIPRPFKDPRQYYIMLHQKVYYMVPLKEFFKYVSVEEFGVIHRLWTQK